MRCLWVVALASALLTVEVSADAPVQASQQPVTAHTARVELIFDAPPDEIYDAVTGDISGWWDHKFSPTAARFFLDPRLGGGFWEYFDAEGREGVRHGVVTFARRPDMLVYQGQLGFAGEPVLITVKYQLSQTADGGTKFLSTSHYLGPAQAEWTGAIEQVWQHFFVDRFAPYVRAGCHQVPDKPCAAFGDP